MAKTADAATAAPAGARRHPQQSRALALLACIALALWLGQARAEPVVLLGSDSLLPVSWREGGLPRGYAVEVANEALTRAGFTVHIKLIPWARAVAEAKTGGGIINQFSKTSEREQLFLFSRPLYVDRVVAVVRKGREFPFESVHDLAGKTVGVLRGAVYGGDWSDGAGAFRREEDGSPESRLKKLLLNRIDVAIISAGPLGLRLAALRAGVDPAAFSVLPTPLLVEQNYLAIAKGPGSLDKLERINAAIDGMQRDGATQKIIDKYVEQL